MRHAHFSPLLVGLAFLPIVACSNGSDTTSEARISCAGGEAFCLVACDLGCNQSGCAITEIAENQRLRFVFSNEIDPASVNNSTVSIRTATGVAAQGDLSVLRNEIVFSPDLPISGTSFGFQRNETYVIALPSASTSGLGIKSRSGRSLPRDFSCSVVASKGVFDEDQQPPRITAVTSPADPTAISLRPVITLQFSELIDTTPLRGNIGASSPLRFLVRESQVVAGVRECRFNRPAVVLEGVPQIAPPELVGGRPVTVVTFSPTVALPGLSCVEVLVTSDLRDLSGRRAVPDSRYLFTIASTSTEAVLREDFINANGMVPDVSGMVWSNGATGVQLGGDGRHGSFTDVIGNNTTVTLNTDNQSIPGRSTFGGQQVEVAGGQFFFTDFILPENVTLTITGSQPCVVRVRGKVEIRGTIDASAAGMPAWFTTSGPLVGQRLSDFNGRGGTQLTFPPVVGQAGGAPGPGGGSGGKGGDECGGPFSPHLPAGPLPANPGERRFFRTNGENGADVRVANGHGFFPQRIDTGGRGAVMSPATGLNTLATDPKIGAFRGHFAGGGSGGGFVATGAAPVTTPLLGATVNAPVAGGLSLPLFPFTGTGGTSALDNFLVGGSGGGGGATHAFGTVFQTAPTADVYVAGTGGSGGGGAVAIRAGGSVLIGGSARLLAKGGEGVLITGDDRTTTTADTNWGVSCPGGGGSGGSFVVQGCTTMQLLGQIDTRGGSGSRTGNISGSFNILSQAGAGSTGFYRLEVPNLSNLTVVENVPSQLFPGYDAQRNAGVLTDADTRAGGISTWRATNLLLPPTWLRYELDVDADGAGPGGIVTYSDDPAFGPTANDEGLPVRIRFQGAVLSQSTGEPTETDLRPWRDFIRTQQVGQSIDSDGATGIRFLLVFNNAVAPGAVVRALRVFYRT